MKRKESPKPELVVLQYQKILAIKKYHKKLNMEILKPKNKHNT